MSQVSFGTLLGLSGKDGHLSTVAALFTLIRSCGEAIPGSSSMSTDSAFTLCMDPFFHSGETVYFCRSGAGEDVPGSCNELRPMDSCKCMLELLFANVGFV
mmetsp:Transcript_29605/g.69800  ORF Transcript_29605/g.69800 Transcript_29605/m.69800 type:complete len:101 (+) Transcript_29605:1808-2110(+)